MVQAVMRPYRTVPASTLGNGLVPRTLVLGWVSFQPIPMRLPTPVNQGYLLARAVLRTCSRSAPLMFVW